MGKPILNQFIKDLTKSHGTLNPEDQQHFPFLILGNDLPSLLLFDFLREKFGQAAVRLLLSQELNGGEWPLPGPNLLRGNENKELLNAMIPGLPLGDQGAESKFFKDQGFRQFSGRMRPSKLNAGEDFFIREGFPFSLPSLLPEKTKTVIEDTKEQHLRGNVIQVDCLKEDDPASPFPGAHFKITCSEGMSYFCDHLFWGAGIRKFYQALKDKTRFSTPFHQFFLKSQKKLCFIVNFECGQEICGEEGTLLIPQSQTHDWGHFIGEFTPFSPESKTQSFSFMAFLEENENNPEDISRKIHLMKRVLSRIFPKFTAHKRNESILLTDKIPVDPIDDALYDKIREEAPHLHFLGMDSPLQGDFMKKISSAPALERKALSHTARSYASFVQAKDLFS